MNRPAPTTDLHTPGISIMRDRLDEHRRRVPIVPVIRFRAFTSRGSERGVDLTPDEAVRIARALLDGYEQVRRYEREHAPVKVAPEVRIAADLAALPEGTLLVDRMRDVGEVRGGHVVYRETRPLTFEYVVKHYAPIRVLDVPEE